MSANKAMYANVQDFILSVSEKQAIELTDRLEPYENAVDETVLTVALVDSSSQIDGYLSGRYTLPLRVVPDNLVRICCDLTRYHLCSMSNVTITDEVQNRYKQAIDELKLLAKGTLSLGIEQTMTEDDSETVVIFAHGNSRVFSRDNQNRKGVD